MKNLTVELEVNDPGYCKVLKDPKTDDIYHVESLLNFKEINKLKRGNANVRPAEQKKRPFKAMAETVENTPGLFHVKNRGITYICTDAKYDEKNGKIVVTIPSIKELKENNEDNVPKYGIADGGHTFEMINQTVRDEKDYEGIQGWGMPFARVHFLVSKNQEEIESIVEALNTSLQVQQYTLDEYQNKFELLKQAMRMADFDPSLVAFRENEDKDWHIIEIIQRMACFLKDRWIGTQPAGMYKSKGKALRLYTNEETRAEFKLLFEVLKDIITLPEYIQMEFSRGSFVNQKSLAKLKCVKALKKTYTRPGTNFPTDHKIDMAALLPLAAGFRELLVKRGDRYQWRLPVREVFEYCRTDLYNLLAERSATVALSNQLASDIELWSGAVQLVLRAKDDLLEGGHRPEKVVTRKKAKLTEPDEFNQDVEAEDELVDAEDET